NFPELTVVSCFDWVHNHERPPLQGPILQTALSSAPEAQGAARSYSRQKDFRRHEVVSAHVNLHPSIPETAPSISVVIPCWNAERWISRAIKSVLGQDYPNLEIIVIDDGSTDNSLEIVKSFGDKVRWWTGPNRGACVARNTGLAMADCTYVMFLDAD